MTRTRAAPTQRPPSSAAVLSGGAFLSESGHLERSAASHDYAANSSEREPRQIASALEPAPKLPRSSSSKFRGSRNRLCRANSRPRLQLHTRQGHSRLFSSGENVMHESKSHCEPRKPQHKAKSTQKLVSTRADQGGRFVQL